MHRLLAIAAVLILAGCNYFVSAPTEAQLSQCLSQPAPGGQQSALYGFKLGQLIDVFTGKGWTSAWRKGDGDRYLLILTKPVGADGKANRLTFEMAGASLSDPAAGCGPEALSIEQMTFNDELVAGPTIGALMAQFMEDHLRRSQLESSQSEQPAQPTQQSQPDPQGAKLDRIFQRDMLGVTIKYLEQITGPARQSYSNVLIYQVDGCDVLAMTKGRTVTALGMRAMNEQCKFDMQRFLPRLPANPTYEDLKDGLGEGVWRTTCLVNCGNAVDPTTFFQARATQAELGLEVVAHGLETPEAWLDLVEGRFSEAELEQRKFNCLSASDSPDVPLGTLATKRPDTLIVGRGMIQPGCAIPKVDVMPFE